MRYVTAIFVFLLSTQGFALTLSFTPNTITVSGLAPRATCVIAGVTHERITYWWRDVRWNQTLTDDDGDGVVTWNTGRPIDFRSVWAAVDLSDGNSIVGAPQTSPATPLDPANFSVTSTDVNTIWDEQVELLLVRPTVGAWSWSGSDNNPLDRDNRFAHVDANTNDVQLLTGSGNLGTIKNGDVVFGVRTSTLEYALVTVGR